jgi:ParB-like chromosome segregation protein Spo0J
MSDSKTDLARIGEFMAQPPKIDPEIAALLPPLTREEFTDLEMKVSVEEFREPLVVWKETGILLDGHHRLKICDKYKIQYFTKELSFPSRERAIQWVIDNQLARRNLTDERRAYYRGKEYLNKKQQHVGQTVSDGQNDHPGQTVSQALAQKHGVGEKTIRRDAEFAQAVDKIGATDPAKKEAILSGKSGQTKQQVTNANNPQILCDRCRRVGAVQGCKACDEARQVRSNTKDRPTHKSKPCAKRPKPGAEKFDWRKFSADFGALLRQVDVLGNAYGVKDTPEAEALRVKLDEWKREFKSYFRKIANQEPPRE